MSDSIALIMSRPPEFQLPTREEADWFVEQGEKMIERLAAARKGKLLRRDNAVRTTTFNRPPRALRAK